VQGKAAFLLAEVPKFVLGSSSSRSWHVPDLDKAQSAVYSQPPRWAFLLTFAGVGVEERFREIRGRGRGRS